VVIRKKEGKKKSKSSTGSTAKKQGGGARLGVSSNCKGKRGAGVFSPNVSTQKKKKRVELGRKEQRRGKRQRNCRERRRQRKVEKRSLPTGRGQERKKGKKKNDEGKRDPVVLMVDKRVVPGGGKKEKRGRTGEQRAGGEEKTYRWEPRGGRKKQRNRKVGARTTEVRGEGGYDKTENLHVGRQGRGGQANSVGRQRRERLDLKKERTPETEQVKN